MDLPEDYVADKFFQYAGAPAKNKYNSTYQGSCPICKEGNSWLKKRRFYYIPIKNRLFCHNCGYSENPINWIKQIAGLTYKEIMNELGDSIFETIPFIKVNTVSKIETLPKDSINIFDDNQISYYANTDNYVKKALDYVKSRRLDNAINRPKALYVSLNDFIHKNRLIIPFYDDNGKIIHYQTRSIGDTSNDIRYLSKCNSMKSIFNFDRVDHTYEYVYIFEGPFNACFTKNGVAVAGIQENSYQLFTDKQEEQMLKIPLHNMIWILDSQWIDSASKKKSQKLLEMGETIFFWPEKAGKNFKDFNQLALALNKNEIATNWIHKNLISGESGLKMLKYI